MELEGVKKIKGLSRLGRSAFRIFREALGPRGAVTPERGHKAMAPQFPAMPWPWNTQPGRQQQYHDLEEMDSEDGIIGKCLDTLADYAVTADEGDKKQAFWFEGKPEHVEILEAMAERTQLRERCWDDVRAMVKYGNWFWEVLFAAGGQELRPSDWLTAGDQQLQVARIKQFPFPYQMNRNEDQFGRQLQGRPGEVEPGKAAWEQYDDAGNLVAQWTPYEIVHLWFGPREGKAYARPILEYLRRHWRRLRAKEDGMAVARITRAFPQLAHRVLVPYGATPEQVKEAVDLYKESMTGTGSFSADDTTGQITTELTKTPIDVFTDFYLVAYYKEDGTVISGSIEELEGSNPHLADLTDIYWDISRMLVRLGVPIKYLSLNLESAKAFVEQDQESVDEAFARLILNEQAAYKRAVWMVCTLELLLHGINPMEAAEDLSIIMAPVSLMGSHVQARIMNLRAQTALMWEKLQIPSGLVGKKLLDMTTAEVEKWQKEREKRQANGEATDDEAIDNMLESYTQPERSSEPARATS